MARSRLCAWRAVGSLRREKLSSCEVMEGCVVPVSHERKSSMIRCDVCGKPIYRAHTIITGSTLEAWCHTCFTAFTPEDSRIFDPENEEWTMEEEEKHP